MSDDKENSKEFFGAIGDSVNQMAFMNQINKHKNDPPVESTNPVESTSTSDNSTENTNKK